MRGMFREASQFNQDISDWNVSKVQDTDFAHFAPESGLEDKHNPFDIIPTAVISGDWLAWDRVEVRSISMGFDENTVTYEWREGENNLDGEVISTAPSFIYTPEDPDAIFYLTLTVKDASGAVSSATRNFWLE